MLLIAIVLGYTTEANIPWWGLLMAIGLSVIMVLPIGKNFQKKKTNEICMNLIFYLLTQIF